MPEFVCRVATPTGEVFDKTFTGTDEASLRHELETQDLMILDLKQRSPFVQHLLGLFRLRGGVSPRDFLSFNQELRALIRAGLPIVPSLDILLERRKNKVFRDTLIDVRERVKGGEAPCVVTAGVPNRMPDATRGLFVSNGIVFLFTVTPACSSARSASRPVTSVAKTSTRRR